MAIEKRKWLLLVSIIATISFFAILYISIIETSVMIEPNNTAIREQIIPFEPFTRDRPRIPIYNSLLSSALLMVAIIPVSYYFMSKGFEERLERKFDVIAKLMKKNNSVSSKTKTKIDDKNIILKFLNVGERKVVGALIEKKGEILQSDINRMEGMTKLKTHRAVRDLERKGIIKRESYGKTNRIFLSKDIKEAIFK
jgi:DNA-binding MarR family transcriptional regulator